MAESSKIRESGGACYSLKTRENADKPLFSCFFEEILYQDTIDPGFLYYIQTQVTLKTPTPITRQPVLRLRKELAL